MWLTRGARNCDEQVTMGFGFCLGAAWMANCRAIFPEPVAYRSNVKAKQLRITFYTKVKSIA